MKKTLALLLALFMLFPLVACVNDSQTANISVTTEENTEGNPEENTSEALEDETTQPAVENSQKNGDLTLMLDKKSTPSTEENPVKPTKTHFFLFSAAGLAVCVLMWLTDLFTYIGG